MKPNLLTDKTYHPERSEGTVISFKFYNNDFIDSTVNTIKHSNVVFSAVVTTHTAGYSSFSNNRLEDGCIYLRDSYRNVTIENNRIINPPKYGISFYSPRQAYQPFGGHRIVSNTFSEMDNKHPVDLKGIIKGASIINNTFEGKNLNPIGLSLYKGSENIEIGKNQFHGIDPINAFKTTKPLPEGHSIEQFKKANVFKLEK